MKAIIILLALLFTVESYSQEYPKSSPNGGRLGGGSWTIKDYQDRGIEDSLFAVKSYKSDLDRAEYLKPSEKPVENPKKRFKEQNEILKIQQEKYEQGIQEATENYNQKIKAAKKYRDDWITYLKANAIAKENAEKERKLKDEKQLLQEEIDARVLQQNAELERKKNIEEFKKMPYNPEYKTWNTKYEKAISLAQQNIDKCEAIIKKHTYKNAFGEKLYDSSTFTELEKNIFNQSLNQLEKYNREIGELENEKKFYHFWNENVSTEKSTSSYRFSSYFKSKNKAY